MKNSTKLAIIIISTFIFSFLLGVSISAESYQFDVSGAKETQGNWAQAFTEYTPLEGREMHEYNFNPLWMTENSEIIAEFRYSGEPSQQGAAPIELIWQTWDTNKEQVPGAVKWAKVAPATCTDTMATFTYKDIVEAYGTDDFSTVYAVNIGDTGTNLKLLKLTCTNIDRSKVPGLQAAKPRHETVANVNDIENNAPGDNSTALTIALVIGGIVLAAGIIFAVILLLKKHGNSGY